MWRAVLWHAAVCSSRVGWCGSTGSARTLAFRSPAVTLLAGMQASSAAIPPLQARMRLRYGGGQQWRQIASAGYRTGEEHRRARLRRGVMLSMCSGGCFVAASCPACQRHWHAACRNAGQATRQCLAAISSAVCSCCHAACGGGRASGPASPNEER